VDKLMKTDVDLHLMLFMVLTLHRDLYMTKELSVWSSQLWQVTMELYLHTDKLDVVRHTQ